MLDIYYKLLKNSILIPESTGCAVHCRKPLATCTYWALETWLMGIEMCFKYKIHKMNKRM